MRNTPVFVIPHRRVKETGFTESFTILFQHLSSFTFSMSLSQEILRKKEEERKKAAQAAAAAGKEKDNKSGPVA